MGDPLAWSFSASSREGGVDECLQALKAGASALKQLTLSC